MAKLIDPDIKQKLNDKEWLMEMHVRQLFSIVELSKQVGVTPATLTKALRSHGIASPSQQALREASNKRKYGVSNPGAVPQFRQKAIETMGGHNWAAGKRDKRDQTCLVKYGNTNVAKTEYAKSKAVITNTKKYGRSHKKQSHIPIEVLHKLDDAEWLYDQHILQQKTLSQIATELGFGSDMTTVMNRMRHHNIVTHLFQHSFAEKEIVAYIKSLTPDEIIENDRSLISPKEVDIYIPSRKLAIEYCGLYWHGELKGKPRLYHRNKMRECNKQGVRLITIFEDEWINCPTIIKTKLAHIFGVNDAVKINARQCEIVNVDAATKNKFYDLHHIQGTGPGSITYGLQYGGTIVAVITFIKQGNVFILNRYATSVSVRGGFTKLLAHFQKHNTWSKIISFADLRWSDGGLYKQAGFVLETTIEPEYAYVVNQERIHKFNMRRKYLAGKLKYFDPDLSEWENCKVNGVDRIWDCGKCRYVLVNDMQATHSNIKTCHK